MPKVEEPNDKIREQIEEILAKEETRGPKPVRIARPTTPRKVRVGTPIWYPTPEKLMAAGMVLLLAAVVTRKFVLPLALGGFLIAGLGYYMLIMRKRRGRFGPSSGGSALGSDLKYWRGKPVKPDQPVGKVKKRDGNVLEFPDPLKNKTRRRFGRKK